MWDVPNCQAVKTLTAKQRQQAREEKEQPILEKLHEWMLTQRSLVPIDNNHIEQQIRPLALGRKNWLFAGSVRAGQRAAAIMTLIQSAKLNGLDPLAYLRDILARLPTQPNKYIYELLPHRWQQTKE